jgi:hypothetical protein
MARRPGSGLPAVPGPGAGGRGCGSSCPGRCGRRRSPGRGRCSARRGLLSTPRLGYCSLVSRRDLIERVLAGLPASSDSVALPDHPLLLQGPDVLASVRNVLTAYFILDRPTHRLPIKVLSNVVLSRLALPRETNFVLVLGEGADIRDNDTEAFEEVVEMSGNRSPRTPAGRMNESRGAELMELLRRPHDERFARAWASTARRRESHHEIAGDPTSLRTPEIRRARTRYMDFDNGSFILPSPGGADLPSNCKKGANSGQAFSHSRPVTLLPLAGEHTCSQSASIEVARGPVFR